jgi:hypothetical protein
MTRAHTTPPPEPEVGRHAAAPALPAMLDRMADVLDPEATVLAEPLAAERRRLRAAERRAAAARWRVEQLRAAGRRVWMVRWRRLLLTIVGLGVLAAVFVLAAVALLLVVPGPLLLVPVTLVLVAVVELARRLRGRHDPSEVTGLAEAAAEAAEAATAVRRARARLSARARRVRHEVRLWCRRHGVPADAQALRRLARQDERRRRHTRRGDVSVEPSSTPQP